MNLSMYENLSQKVGYVKQMQNKNQHSKIKKMFLKMMMILINLLPQCQKFIIPL